MLMNSLVRPGNHASCLFSMRDGWQVGMTVVHANYGCCLCDEYDDDVNAAALREVTVHMRRVTMVLPTAQCGSNSDRTTPDA
jgi:hypothetical protein